MDLDTLVSQLRAEPAAAEPDDTPSDLADLYTKVGLSPASPGAYSQTEVVNHLYAQIKVHANNEAWGEAKLLEKRLIYEHVLDDVNPHPHIDILAYALDALRGDGGRAETDWAKVFEFAHLVLKICKRRLTPELIFKQRYQRHYNIAEAAVRLRDTGAEIQMKQATLTLVDPDPVLDQINILIGNYGGLKLTYDIFTLLKRVYDPFLRRYRLYRATSQIPKQRAPQKPFPYILHLAARHVATSASAGIVEVKLSEILLLVSDLTTLLDAEPYSIWERVYPGKLIPFVQKEIIYDSVFTLEQFNPKHLLDLVKQVFMPFSPEECQKAWGASHAEALAFVRFFLLRSGAYTGPQVYEVASLPERTGLPTDVVNSLLGLFVHSKTPNEDYRLPLDICKRDLPFAPLQRVDAARVWLADPSWCALRFYETLVNGLRQAKLRNVDDRVGKEGAEELLTVVLERAGLTAHSGTYRYGAKGQERECDCIVETPTDIVIIELKKKALTRAARGGDDASLIIDLCRSLLEAHNQCAIRELDLRDAGSIELDGHVIALGQRRVLRVALTLTEFGSLHDREILRHFLTLTSNSLLSASDPKIDKRLDAFRRAQQKHQATLHEAMARHFTEQDRQQPFFHSYFMGMGHLMTLLEDVHSPTEFSERLAKLRHMSTSSGDLYIELSEQRRLDDPATHTAEAKTFEREIQRAQAAATESRRGRSLRRKRLKRSR